VPQAEQALSSLHCMAAGECGEAASGVVRRVLEEDVVLGFSAQICGMAVRRAGQQTAKLESANPGLEVRKPTCCICASLTMRGTAEESNQ